MKQQIAERGLCARWQAGSHGVGGVCAAQGRRVQAPHRVRHVAPGQPAAERKHRVQPTLCRKRIQDVNDTIQARPGPGAAPCPPCRARAGCTCHSVSVPGKGKGRHNLNQFPVQSTHAHVTEGGYSDLLCHFALQARMLCSGALGAESHAWPKERHHNPPCMDSVVQNVAWWQSGLLANSMACS